jgi:hemerythrin-like domain-containing protein
MIKVMNRELLRAEKEQKIDPRLIETATDFIRAYADRCHHGKEEDILFRDLEKKQLTEQDSREMAQLVEEHRQARQKVRDLVAAKERFLSGDAAAVGDVLFAMEWLTGFYPRHIAKEDREFFPRTERYFSRNELDEMLQAFKEFDGKMITRSMKRS